MLDLRTKKALGHSRYVKDGEKDIPGVGARKYGPRMGRWGWGWDMRISSS